MILPDGDQIFTAELAVYGVICRESKRCGDLRYNVGNTEIEVSDLYESDLYKEPKCQIHRQRPPMRRCSEACSMPATTIGPRPQRRFAKPSPSTRTALNRASVWAGACGTRRRSTSPPWPIWPWSTARRCSASTR